MNRERTSFKAAFFNLSKRIQETHCVLCGKRKPTNGTLSFGQKPYRFIEWIFRRGPIIVDLVYC